MYHQFCHLPTSIAWRLAVRWSWTWGLSLFIWALFFILCFFCGWPWGWDFGFTGIWSRGVRVGGLSLCQCKHIDSRFDVVLASLPFPILYDNKEYICASESTYWCAHTGGITHITVMWWLAGHCHMVFSSSLWFFGAYQRPQSDSGNQKESNGTIFVPWVLNSRFGQIFKGLLFWKPLFWAFWMKTSIK